MTDTSTTNDTAQERTAAHTAGILAHGLHAVAHHIALHRLPVLSIDAYPAGADRGTPVIKVQVSSFDVETWLPTVYVDEVHDDRVGEKIHQHRYVRLADTGVVVDLLCVVAAPAPFLVTGGVTGGAA